MRSLAVTLLTWVFFQMSCAQTRPTNTPEYIDLDSAAQKSFLYTNAAQFLFTCQPNLGYEWRLWPRASLSVNGGYKFPNYPASFLITPSVSYYYSGPRADVSIKKFSPVSNFFWGANVRSSLLWINTTISIGHSSQPDGIQDLNGRRTDLDCGVILGIKKFGPRCSREMYAVIGIRNVWAKTTYKRIQVSPDELLGAIPGYDKLVLNGYLSFVLFQVGVNFSIPNFFAKGLHNLSQNAHANYPER